MLTHKELKMNQRSIYGMDLLPFIIMEEDPFKYFVRIVSDDRAKFNDERNDGQLCEPSQWCVENVGLNGHTWRRLTYNPWGQKAMVFYYFREQAHASMFKLTFGDY